MKPSLKQPTGIGFQWGTMRLENKDGAWEGSFRAAAWGDPVEARPMRASWMVGSGAYKGLTLYLHFRGHAGPPADVDGVILPVPPPATP